MRFLASTILAAALALPAMAQPGRGGPDRERPGQDPKAEIERLRERLKDLEALQKQAGDADKKKDEKKKDEKKYDEKKKDEAKKPDPKQEEQRGPGARGPQGPPMGGFGPGGFGPGGPMGGFRGREGFGGQAGPGFAMPGMDKLSPEEQATFKKLVAKMTGRGETEARKPDAPKQPQGGKPDAPKEGGKPNPGKPNLEERLDRLEKMVQELVRNQRGR